MYSFLFKLEDQASKLFLVALAITVYEVAMRYAFNAPTTWVTALSTCLCAICFALGGAPVMARDEHIRVTPLIDRFTPGPRKLAELLALLCGAVYLAGLGYAAVLEAWNATWRFDEGRWSPEPLPGPPGWPLPALIRVALATGSLLFLAVVLRKAARLVKPGDQ